MTISADAVVHPTAVIEDGAVIAAGAVIGPYCCVGSDVSIAPRVELKSHVVVSGWTEIGADTVVYPFAAVGAAPQDLKYQGERSRLVIGARNQIREATTMSIGTEGGGGVTRVGDDGLFMAGAHVGHDCVVGDRVIMANNATLGGHVTVGDYAFFGGLCAVHQFTRVGAHSMIGGMCGVVKDVIPFGSVLGNRAALGGLNIVGLKRRGFDRETIHALRQAYGLLFSGDGVLADRVEVVAETFPDIEPVQQIVAFIRADSSRSFCTPREA